MSPLKLSKLELEVMELLWKHGSSSVREVHERFDNKPGPASTTIQTIIARLKAKGAVRTVKKVGGAHIYEASVSREEAKRRLIDISFRP
jgi:BlaI family penicillinase repressor